MLLEAMVNHPRVVRCTACLQYTFDVNNAMHLVGEAKAMVNYISAPSA